MNGKVDYEHVLEIVTQAKQLISDPAKRCTRALAKNAEGEEVETTSASACSWCVIGAVYRVTDDYDYRLRICNLLDLASMTLFDGKVAAMINDGRYGLDATPEEHAEEDHRRVMAIYDYAITMASAQILKERAVAEE